MIPLMVPCMPTADKIRPYLCEIDHNRWYTNFGPLEKRFREQLHQHLHLKEDTEIVLANNGTTALQLALEAFQLPAQSICLMPSWTFSASALAVVKAGLIPHFIDVDPDSWMITPENVEDVIESTNIQPRCVMVVVPFGAPFNIKAWESLALKHDLSILIDAAASHENIPTSTIPLMISLHATKMLSMGEGGAILSTDKRYMARVKSLSNFGFADNRIAETIGSNGKVSEYSAAIGLAMLETYTYKRHQLMERAKLYLQEFNNIKGIRFQPGFGENWIGSTFNIELQTGTREAFQEHLLKNGIESRQWWIPCHSQPAFRSFSHESLTVTESLATRVIGLPFHTFLTASDIQAVTQTVRTFLKQSQARMAS